jgi:predicted flap endonuclease-1-like 5' DNA nuclease
MTKAKYEVKEVNCETGEEVIRDATAEETAKLDLDAANSKAKKAEAEAKETAKAAILARIGLTADELQTILG